MEYHTTLIFEKNGKLVVGLDVKKALEFNEEYSKNDVKSDLDTSLDIDVKYYIFEREANVRGGDVIAEGITSNDDAATITLVRNNKIITTGNGFDKNQILIAGISGEVGCREIRITYNPHSNPQGADASYGIDTSNSACDHNYINNPIHHNGRHYSVIDGTARDIGLNDFIRMVGKTTPTSSGYILDTDVTVKDSRGVLDNQVVANYPSDKGDSGAPIFKRTGPSTAKIIGQHVGKFCEVDLHSGTNYAQ